MSDIIKDTIYYNIHNILSIQVNRPKCFDICKDISLPFSYFETKQIEKPDVIVNIGSYKPHNNECHVIDHKYYIKNSYIYCSERVGKITIDVEIRNLEGNPTIINVSSNIIKFKQFLFPFALMQYVVLRPLIDYKLLSKNILSLHAAAVACKDESYVFLGRGGTYKTTLLMDYIRKMNYSFLGDDRVLVNKNIVMSYPLNYKLFDYRVGNMETEDFSVFDKYKYFLNTKSNREKPQYIVDKSNISSFYSINKSMNKRFEITQKTKTEVISKTLYSHKMETIGGLGIMGISKGLYDYFTAYSYVFPDSKIAHYWDDYELLLTHFLNQETFYEISLPLHYTSSTFNDFMRIIKRLENNSCKLETIPSII